MMKVQPEIRSCDVLVVGGGMAGLMAAIAAADKGADVIVAEKAHTLRSGSGATGNDHFRCYIPEIHGTPKAFYDEFLVSQVGSGGFYDRNLQMQYVMRSFECVKSWHEWGINMQPHGDWEFSGHALPGRMITTLKYDGRNQKEVLTREAKKRGVRIENKSPITEFLVNDNDEVIGALGIDISTDEPSIKLYKARSIVSTTGNTSRLYPSITPGWMFNQAYCPADAGGGRAAAYRAGAKLVNLEMPYSHAGPKYFERCGKGTFIGVLADAYGKPSGPFVTKPNRETGDVTVDIWKDIFSEKQKDGTAPVYMDCSQTSDEDIEYMMWGFVCEGDTSMIDIMEKQGIDLKKHMIEFTKYEPLFMGRGIQIDDKGMTNIKGLFSAGDEIGNFRADMGGAAVYGRIAGENAGEYVANHHYDCPVEDHPVVEEAKAFYTSLMERETGASWKELNLAVQQLLRDYAGVGQVRSETLLKAGIKNLSDLQNFARKSMKCNDAHELMRALETFDLALLAQLICTSAIERKETRGWHVRSDYTYTNPLLEGQFITIEKGPDGQPKIDWRKRLELDDYTASV